MSDTHTATKETCVREETVTKKKKVNQIRENANQVLLGGRETEEGKM